MDIRNNYETYNINNININDIYDINIINTQHQFYNISQYINQTIFSETIFSETIFGRTIPTVINNADEDEDLLAKLIHKFNENENKFNMTECPITLIPFTSDQLVITLTCGHIFDCIALKEWYKSKNTCPICKSNIR